MFSLLPASGEGGFLGDAGDMSCRLDVVACSADKFLLLCGWTVIRSGRCANFAEY